MAYAQKIHQETYLRVVHPLDDVAETKCSSEGLGPMAMTRSVRWSLIALRVYLVAMGILLAYHVLELASVFTAKS